MVRNNPRAGISFEYFLTISKEKKKSSRRYINATISTTACVFFSPTLVLSIARTSIYVKFTRGQLVFIHVQRIRVYTLLFLIPRGIGISPLTYFVMTAAFKGYITDVGNPIYFLVAVIFFFLGILFYTRGHSRPRTAFSLFLLARRVASPSTDTHFKAYETTKLFSSTFQIPSIKGVHFFKIKSVKVNKTTWYTLLPDPLPDCFSPASPCSSSDDDENTLVI